MRQYLFPLILLFLFQGLLNSCKKELSCEGCLDNSTQPEFNKPPIAKAGPDQSLLLPADSTFLDGSLSSDPDGAISVYQWTKIAGPTIFSLIRPDDSITVVKNLMKGIYQFELKVTDNEGLSAKDTIQVIVSNPTQPNRPPVANAGPNQSIYSQAITVNLDGSGSADPDNNITQYQWTKISGPSTFNIVNANAVITQVTNLIEGVYEFELMVTDAFGLYSKDTVQIIVVTRPPPCTDCKIVFVSNRDGNDEIYTCNADGSGIVRLTNNTDVDSDPAWSPDGSRIAFISDRSGNRELYIMNSDGSNVVRRTFSEGYPFSSPTWSPGGDKIAYSKLNGSYSLWVVNSTSGSPSFLFHWSDDLDPAWSPDGTKIALTELIDGIATWNDISTINADGTGFTALTGSDIYDCVDYMRPSWSPDGTKIAVAIQGSLNCGSASQIAKVGIMNIDGTGVTAIISSGVNIDTRTSWSGDGIKIAYTSLSGNVRNISWVAADGSASGLIVTNGWDADWQH